MTNLSKLSNQEMRNACHALAAQVGHTPARTNRCKWLRDKVFELLKADNFIDIMTDLYSEEYPYAEVPTEYLAAVLRAYDAKEDV